MTTAHILGYPRIGKRRELKIALEAFWRGEADERYLRNVGAGLRAAHWDRQSAGGLGFITAGDFAFYDLMLNQAVLLGCPPPASGSIRPRSPSSNTSRSPAAVRINRPWK